MTTLATFIEQDNLEEFKKHFDIQHWRDSIASIENYAGVTTYTPTVSYNDADCFKYALHCNADKIFDYLLPLVDTHKHGDNYGWPLLAMAIKNNRYDYANKIIDHPSFNPYHMYHMNTFHYVEKQENIPEHIEFLFHYLNKFTSHDFSDSYFVYDFTSLICYSEETYNRFEQFYQQKTKQPNISLLEIYQDNWETLGKEIFYYRYNSRMIEKLSVEQKRAILEASMDNKIFFSHLFESENAKEGITYLLPCADLLKKYLEDNQVVVSYLPLDCILLLEKHGIDIWKNNDKERNILDYILDDSDIHSEVTWYFINKYTQEIYDRLNAEGRKCNIQKYCHQKLLKEQLSESTQKPQQRKI